MDNEFSRFEVRCRFSLEKQINPELHEIFSKIPSSQHSKLILVMLDRVMCYEKQMEAFQNRPLIGSQPNVSPVAVQSTPQQYQQEPALPKPKKANHKEQPREDSPVDDDSGAIRPVSASALAGFGLN